MQLAPHIRAFVAARLSAETDRALTEMIEQLRAANDGISWARKDNLHLTLRFLGAAVDSRLIPPFIAALDRVAQETSPFVAETRGIGAFPNLARPRVIWAGLESPELVALAGRVEHAAVESGFEAERRRYSPHLTLGRVRDLRGWTRLRPKMELAIERQFGSSTIETMMLYESRLSSSGAFHSEIASFELSSALTPGWSRGGYR